MRRHNDLPPAAEMARRTCCCLSPRRRWRRPCLPLRPRHARKTRRPLRETGWRRPSRSCPTQQTAAPAPATRAHDEEGLESGREGHRRPAPYARAPCLGARVALLLLLLLPPQPALLCPRQRCCASTLARSASPPVQPRLELFLAPLSVECQRLGERKEPANCSHSSARLMAAAAAAAAVRSHHPRRASAGCSQASCRRG